MHINSALHNKSYIGQFLMTANTTAATTSKRVSMCTDKGAVDKC